MHSANWHAFLSRHNRGAPSMVRRITTTTPTTPKKPVPDSVCHQCSGPRHATPRRDLFLLHGRMAGAASRREVCCCVNHPVTSHTRVRKHIGCSTAHDEGGYIHPQMLVPTQLLTHNARLTHRGAGLTVTLTDVNKCISVRVSGYAPRPMQLVWTNVTILEVRFF
ncbi:uncharacterized protein LOC105926793 [Fundulus heteroclitus]|uniref:uncharacterized protein LOC105926793 n=1 Tax=Fundulus heteroclitus TaxID=8078 RepID=UPI00165CE125|nr:uncharacterized protein LOC105926793 [Fundulus heteroclitus]